MPIYEFRCSTCNEYFELLLMNTDESVELCCPKCASKALERVISTSNYAMGAGRSGVKSESKTCSSGSCTTWEIPGPTR